MINVLYHSLDVCFCFMFPQTKYEYDPLLLRQNDSFYFIYPFILHCYRMFSLPFKCTLYILYTSKGVFIWRINYCHCYYGNLLNNSRDTSISLHPHDHIILFIFRWYSCRMHNAQLLLELEK